MTATQVSLASLRLVAALGLVAIPSAAIAEGDIDISKAKELFVETHRCVRCHSVAAEGLEATSEKMKSKDLSGYTTEDVAALARFIRKEEDRGDVKHKKTFEGTDEELEAVLAWLGSLEPAAEESPGAE